MGGCRPTDSLTLRSDHTCLVPRTCPHGLFETKFKMKLFCDLSETICLASIGLGKGNRVFLALYQSSLMASPPFGQNRTSGRNLFLGHLAKLTSPFMRTKFRGKAAMYKGEGVNGWSFFVLFNGLSGANTSVTELN